MQTQLSSAICFLGAAVRVQGSPGPCVSWEMHSRLSDGVGCPEDLSFAAFNFCNILKVRPAQLGLTEDQEEGRTQVGVHGG